MGINVTKNELLEEYRVKLSQWLMLKIKIMSNIKFISGLTVTRKSWGGCQNWAWPNKVHQVWELAVRGGRLEGIHWWYFYIILCKPIRRGDRVNQLDFNDKEMNGHSWPLDANILSGSLLWKHEPNGVTV